MSTETYRLHAYLTQEEITKLQDIVVEIVNGSKKRVSIGNVYAAVIRHGLNNPEKIKEDFLL